MYGSLCVAWTSFRYVMLLTCSLADVTLVYTYHAGPSPATTGVLKLEPSDAARSGNMLRIAQAELPL